VQHLPKALLLALLVGAPVMGQQEWAEFRDLWLGQFRGNLMYFCNIGRRLNSNGQSYWEEGTGTMARELSIKSGKSEETAKNILSGLAAAMAVACPEVK
jgi:hypothetical protein